MQNESLSFSLSISFSFSVFALEVATNIAQIGNHHIFS